MDFSAPLVWTGFWACQCLSLFLRAFRTWSICQRWIGPPRKSEITNLQTGRMSSRFFVYFGLVKGVKLGGGFKYFYVHPCLGKWSNLTNIFQMGWNHQLGNVCLPKWAFQKNLGERCSFCVCFFCGDVGPMLCVICVILGFWNILLNSMGIVPSFIMFNEYVLPEASGR